MDITQDVIPLFSYIPPHFTSGCRQLRTELMEGEGKDEGQWFLPMNRCIWFTIKTSQAQVEGTDSETLGMNFKEISPANQFSNTPVLPLSFVAPLQAPFSSRAGKCCTLKCLRAVNLQTNLNCLKQLLFTPEKWLDLNNLPKEWGLRGQKIQSYLLHLCYSCAPSLPYYNFTAARQPLPRVCNWVPSMWPRNVKLP